jgi:hypothetical protein
MASWNTIHTMINKKLILGFVLLLGVLVSLNLALAVGEISYCAEKTKDGAWCQNVPLEEVDTNFRSVAASCDATSYCKLGTCVNSQEGTCLENTPQIVCEEPVDNVREGFWFDKEPDSIPQCTLGCCLIGDQAAFTTQVRCTQLSSLYGLDTNYRTDIRSEVECISTATSEAKGACVFQEDFGKTCKYTTRGECQEVTGKLSVPVVQNTTGEGAGLLQNLLGSGGDSENPIQEKVSAEFHEGLLCSAEELATNCGPSEKTTLVEGQDEVYFVDTCGNLGNIYDASRFDDQNYWRDSVGKGESCGFGQSNAGSESCGNCDYFLGSTGKKYNRGDDPVKPRFGDNICRDLSCEFKGESFEHGETWCAVSSENEKNLPGSRYFRQVCYNGDVTIEPCADFRQEVCIQDEVNGFRTAACRVNQWQDCVAQNTEQDCENTDRRDCSWAGDKCTPKFAPGFNFWQEGDADTLCKLANNQCVVEYEKGIFGSYECSKNCDCLEDSWQDEQNGLCVALGDCGSITNYIGREGFNGPRDAVIKQDEVKEEEPEK